VVPTTPTDAPHGTEGATQRIVVVSHYFLPHVGGIEQVVARQCQSLRQRGHDVTLVTSAHRKVEPDATASFSAPFRVRRSRALNLLETRFGVPFPVPGPAMLRHLWREIGRADRVHLHDVFYLPSQLAFLVAWLRRRPFHVTQHVALVDHPNRLVMAVQKAIYRTVGGLMLRRALSVITYNVIVHDHVLGLGVDPDKAALINNGVDVTYFVPATPEEKRALRRRFQLPEERPVVLFVGRLVPKKGHDLVLSAASDSHTTLIVGEGVVTHDADRPNVVLFGPATQPQLRDLYRLSDLFVFPAAGEIFTLVMQEAMACGLPVITTDEPGYGRYGITPGMIRFCPRTPEAVAGAVRSLLDDDHLRQAMSAYSRRLAEVGFSWESNYNREYEMTHGGSLVGRRQAS
jgi:glycosyltransferase involved in cell wall biosynthesis